jgi:hypothetical protein
MNQILLRRAGIAILYILILSQFEIWLDFDIYYGDYDTFTEMISECNLGRSEWWLFLADCLILRPFLALIATIIVSNLTKYAVRIVDRLTFGFEKEDI